MRVFQIVIDFSLSLLQMVEAGKYDYWDDGIVRSKTGYSYGFRVVGTGVLEFPAELVLFEEKTSLTHAELLLEKRGLRPAKIEELLAFGATYPEVQGEIQIFATGSIGNKGTSLARVPYLCGHAKRRGLDVEDSALHRTFNRKWYMLAVPIQL